MTETKYEDWKDHYLTRSLTSSEATLFNFRISERIQVKDLSVSKQQQYHNFLLTIKKKQEEFADNFMYEENYGEEDYIFADDMRKAFEQCDLKVPHIDTWKWKSSKGEIILKDLWDYYPIDGQEGETFFFIDGKHYSACINNGSKLVEATAYSDLCEEFNQQLDSFNYVRAKQCSDYVKLSKMLL